MARRFLRLRLQNRSGDVLRGGWVNVVQHGTDTEVDLYAAIVGGSPLSQPRTTDSSGQVEVWTDDLGELDVIWSDSGATYLPIGNRTSFSTFEEFVPAAPCDGPPLVNVRTVCEALGYNDTTSGTPVLTVPVRAALDACPEGGVLYFPAGKYKFGTLTLKNGITVCGDVGQQDDLSGNTHLYLATGTNASMFVIPVGVTMVTFQGIDCIGNQANQTGGTSHGVYIVEAASVLAGDYCGVIFQGRCNFRDFRTDGVFYGHNRRGLLIGDEVNFYSNGRNGATIDSSDYFIRRGRFYGNVNAGIETKVGHGYIEADCYLNAYGIDVIEGYGNDTGPVTITAGHTDKNSLAGIRVGSPGTVIVGTQFECNSWPVTGTGQHLIVREAADGQVSIVGCRFGTNLSNSAATPVYAIYLEGTATATAAANTFDGTSIDCNTPAQIDGYASLDADDDLAIFGVKLTEAAFPASLARLASPTFTGTPTSPTPTAADNDTSIATTAFVQSAIGGAGFTYLRPSGAKGESFPGRSVATADGAVLATGRLHLVAVPLEAGTLLTSITFAAKTTAGAAMTNQWFGIFDSARVPLRLTADDTSTAWAANSLKTLNLSSTFTTTYSGLHYFGIMVAGGTVPSLVCMPGGSTYITDIAPIIAGQSTTGLTNPASCTGTQTAITAVASVPYTYAS